jgi:spermidine/putrescine transport system ATP-binding protein
MTAAPAVSLREVCKRFADHAVVDRVTLDVGAGEFFSLLGPSGCGKTTLLRLLAGFESPTAGTVWLNGVDVTPAPVRERDLNLVFQHYALFPHLTVTQNVAFGLEMQRVARDEVARRVAEALALVQLTGLEARLPRALSGGQQQRVALARAIVTRPAVLLLDEPLGALDLQLRRAMQQELKTLQRRLGMTFIYVTHDQEEALVMSDRIGVMQHGRLLQVGTPRELYERPATRFVAGFLGESNFLPARVAARSATGARVTAGAATFDVAAGLAADGDCMLAIRPEHILLSADTAPRTPNSVSGTIDEAMYLGSDMRYVVAVTEALRLTVRTPAPAQAYHVGQRVQLALPADALRPVSEDLP